MQSLLGGADCSTASNPLQQMLKREGVDRSLMRDQNVASSSSSLQRLPQSLPFRPSSATPFAVQPQPHLQRGDGGRFDMSRLSSDLLAPTASAASAGPRYQDRSASHSPWGGEFQQFASNSGQVNVQNRARDEMERVFMAQRNSQSQPQPQQLVGGGGGGSNWTGDYHQFSTTPNQFKGKGREEDIYRQQSFPAQDLSSGYQFGGGLDYASPYASGIGMGGGMSGYQQPFQAHLPPQAQIVPLQMEDKDLDAAFERALKEEEERLKEEKVVEDVKEGKENGSGMGDFEKVWQSLKPEAERLGKLAEWEQQFSQFTNGAEEDDFNFDEMGGMDALRDQFDIGRPGGEVVGEDGYPILGDYEFEQENPHVQDSQSLQRALDLLSSGGSLTEAALLLEATISSGTAEEQASRITTFGGGGEAGVWVLLGQTQAMDEKEVAAVRALEEGRKKFEGRELSGEAKKMMGEGLISLAISYTNETYDHSALLSLHRYLSLLHPQYAGAVPTVPGETIGDEDTMLNPWSANLGLTNSYLTLARDQHQSGVVDADIQVGLGVLYYQTGEFEKARDCWVAALGVRPNDFLLWNRLGATLANGGHPEEAIDAYRRALELKPTFTRAIYNLGVSCLNIGVYQEAAEHLLAGLALHQTHDHQPNMTQSASAAAINHSSTLWSTLRRTFLAMERPDLAEKAAAGTDLNVFRGEGFDF